MKIKEILTIDLSEDITNVIDMENIQEEELLSEIENYIVTDGLASEFDKLADVFSGNVKETGIWLSGFYGSGKSYLGKLWGYILSNPVILGTPAREIFYYFGKKFVRNNSFSGGCRQCSGNGGKYYKSIYKPARSVFPVGKGYQKSTR